MQVLGLSSDSQHPTRGHPAVPGGNFSIMLRTFFAWSFLIASAVAQAGSPVQQIDPGAPGPGGGPIPEWSIVPIEELASGSTLGSVWAGPAGHVYVWSSRTQVLHGGGLLDEGLGRTDAGNPPEPGDPNPVTVTIATLHHWNGMGWTVELEKVGEMGASLTGDEKGHVYAATDLPDGGVRLYGFDGKFWRTEQLPYKMLGPAGAITMNGDRMYFRTGSAILHGSLYGVWYQALEDPKLVHGRGLAWIGNAIFAPCSGAQAVFDGFKWSWQEQPALEHAHGAWGDRDIAGNLHLFASGCDAQECGPHLFEFVEDFPGSLTGRYQVSVRDAPPGGHGDADAIGGSGVHHILAGGSLNGCAHLYHFDGDRWVKVSPLPEMTPAAGVAGTAEGIIWVSLTDGRMLRHAAPTLVPSLGHGGGRSGLPRVVPEDAARPAAAARLTVARSPDGFATVEYALPADGPVSIVVYDVAGRQVDVLEQAHRPAGTHRIGWDVRGLANGVYVCRLRTGEWSASRVVSFWK
jgi:hypothetical protein